MEAESITRVSSVFINKPTPGGPQKDKGSLFCVNGRKTDSN